MSLSLGIDIGTSGVRTAVLNGEGTLVATARAAHPAQDPDRIDATLWWRAVEKCLAVQVSELLAVDRDPMEITGIAVDGTSGSMVLTDAALEPVGRALMYNSSGFEKEAARIANHAPNPHITRGSNSALARAIRLSSEAEVRPAQLLHQADFITAKLRGTGKVSDHNNAMKTGFDPQENAWPLWIDKVLDSDLLPKVHATGTDLGEICPTIARRIGVSPATRICAGTTDSCAAFLASAPMEPGIAVTSLGSTLAVKILSRTRISAPDIGLYSHRIDDLWLAGGASNTGGAVLAAHFSPETISRLCAEINPDTTTGLDYYPLNAPGERFPINDPNLPPRLGPRPEHDAEFLKAMFEGIAGIEAKCYRVIQEHGGDPPRRILSAGGGAANPIFTRIRANALGQVPEISAQSEAAVGAARLAAMCKTSR